MRTTPPKGNRGRNRARRQAGNAPRPRTDPGRETRLAAPRGDSSVGRDWRPQPERREPVSVALADDQFVSYIFPSQTWGVSCGESGFFFFFLAPQLSAVLGLTFVYVVMKHSAVLCEV